MLIASYSAEPLARASATFDRQLPVIAERRPERRAISTVKPMTTRAPSAIHSHSSEVADVPDLEDFLGVADDGLGEAGSVTVDVVGGAVTVVGGGVVGETGVVGEAGVVGESAGEPVTPWADATLDTAALTWLMVLPQPAIRQMAARIDPARTSLFVSRFIRVPP
jgi:hypothetical protein